MPPRLEQKKGLAITSLVLGILSVLTFGCLGVGALAGLIVGIVALVKISKAPDEYAGKGMAIGGVVASGLSLVLLPFMGIIAAIAIPSLLRARVSANEASAIGDIRTVISAEAAYQATNGFYGPPECLAGPSGCVPGYQGPTFLDPALASAQVKSGYRRVFQGEPVADDPNRLAGYAYVAVPAQRNQTGVRSFCGDASGRICAYADGRDPVVSGGSCDPACPILP